MEPKEQIIIPTNRRFLVLGLLCSILFIVIGIVMFNSEPSSKYSSVFLQSWALIATIFFGLTGLYCLKKLFDKKPGLILDENGLWNNSSIISNHTIKWNELSGVSLTKFGKEEVLFLYFKDEKSFVRKFNLMERLLMRLNLFLYNSPIGISTRGLYYDSDKLNRQIQYRIEKWA